ncbi:MAG: hypothetical protein AABY15_04110 [Nanoarchaeota archaeon]
MNQLSAFVIKFNQPNSPEIEYNLEREIYVALKAFTDEEQKGFIMDEESRTMIAFIEKNDKPKLDGLVDAVKKVQSDIISEYEDVTEKFLFKNDFSCYNKKSKLIDGFIKSRISLDDVFDKIKTIGADKLTEVDKGFLEEWRSL